MGCVNVHAGLQKGMLRVCSPAFCGALHCTAVVQTTASCCRPCCGVALPALKMLSSRVCACVHSHLPSVSCHLLQLLATRASSGGRSLAESCADVAASVRENVSVRRAFRVDAPAGEYHGACCLCGVQMQQLQMVLIGVQVNAVRRGQSCCSLSPSAHAISVS